MKFLVVDNDSDTLLLVRANVRAWGHECLVTEWADEAERLCRDEAPDVLLLDVAMPGTDGPTLLQRLRDAGSVPAIVLLLSAVAPEELADVARQLGVDWLSKPFTAEGFRAKMSMATGGVIP